MGSGEFRVTQADRFMGLPRFRIEWVETGGPPAHEPTRQGFGTRIIVDVPRVKLDAQITTEYLMEGFRWSLTCAASSIG